MYSRITASSRPTVDTKYPRAQKCCPTKLRFTFMYVRAMWIALFPLMYPTTCATEYFGGIDSSMWDVIGHQVPFLHFALPLLRKRSEDRPEFPTKLTKQRLPSVLRDEDDVVLALPS